MKTITISGVIGWEVLADDVRKQLAEAKGKPIEVEINSPGGLVSEGIEIYNLIKNYKGEKTTRIMGVAASMASYIALAGDKVKAEGNAIYMIHNALGCTCGDHREMLKTASILEGITSLLAKAYTRKTGKTATEIRDMMDEESWFFGSEIKDAGFVDELIDADEAEDKSTALTKAKLELHACIKRLESVQSVDVLEKAAAMIEQPKNDVTPEVSDEAQESQDEDGVDHGNQEIAEQASIEMQYQINKSKLL